MRSWGVCLLQAFHVYLYFLTQWSISGWHTFGKVPRDGGCPLVVLSVIFVCESASVHPQQNCINIVSDHQMEHTDFIYHVCMHGDRLVGLSSQWQLMCFVKNKLFSTQGSNLALGIDTYFAKFRRAGGCLCAVVSVICFVTEYICAFKPKFYQILFGSILYSVWVEVGDTPIGFLVLVVRTQVILVGSWGDFWNLFLILLRRIFALRRTRIWQAA